MISIIAAVAENGVIGYQGKLPWHLPEDFKHFKKMTKGKPIIMGRLTFESIGKALPKRPNIIVTRKKRYNADGCHIVSNPGSAIEIAQKYKTANEVMIIGGAEIYSIFLPIVDRLYLTRVQVSLKGDTWFPSFDKNLWRLRDQQFYIKDKKNCYNFTTQTWERKNA